MADVLITNYTTLRSVVAQWMAREGSTRFNDQTSLFVQLAEAEINKRLRVAEQTTNTTLAFAADTGAVALPTDFGGLRGLPCEVGSFNRPLDYLTPSQIDTRLRDPSLRDPPRLYTIRALQLEVKPIPGEATDIGITYYRKVPALRDEVSGTNWLLDGFPDIYLAGTMYQAHSYQSNSAKAGEWLALFDQRMEALEDMDWNDRWSGSPIVEQTRTTEGRANYPRFRIQGVG